MKIHIVLASFTDCIKERAPNLQWKVITQNRTSLFFAVHTHTPSDAADNTFACDAFLCDVKLAAPGLRHRMSARGTGPETTKRNGAGIACTARQR